MKKDIIRDLVEDLMMFDEPQIIAEMPNGVRIPVKDFYHSGGKSGGIVVVLELGEEE